MQLLARIAALAQADPSASRRRLAGWLVTHVATSSVDIALAAGADPDVDPRRAIRARALVDPRYRTSLASHWHEVLARASSATPVREARVPIPRHRVLAARGDIALLIGALRTPGPVPVRGVALARRLLIDADGPLYGRSDAAALRSAAREAVHHLDPARPLFPGGLLS